MKTFIREADVINVVSPSGGTTSGVGYVIGALFGVAVTTTLVGEAAPLQTTGVISLAKATGITFTQGEKVFWDNTAKAIKKTATGYFLVGVATAAAASGDTAIPVRLDGIAVTAA
jgi:predicted RecA/RadA family phage recombinase